MFIKITKTTNKWNLSQQKISKRENRFLTPNKTYLNLPQAFSSPLLHPCSRPIPVANVQEFFSLSRCLLMSYGVSHRCLTIVMQRMCCQRWTWRVGNSSYILAVMGHPKDASGCHCVLSLCQLMYCHLPNISPWRFRRFQIPPAANTTY